MEHRACSKRVQSKPPLAHISRRCLPAACKRCLVAQVREDTATRARRAERTQRRGCMVSIRDGQQGRHLPFLHDPAIVAFAPLCHALLSGSRYTASTNCR